MVCGTIDGLVGILGSILALSQLFSGPAAPTKAEASSAFAAASPGSGCSGCAVPSSISDTTCELAGSSGSYTSSNSVVRVGPVREPEDISLISAC